MHISGEFFESGQNRFSNNVFLKDPEDKFLPALWTRSQLMSKEAGSEDNDLAREVGRMIIEHFDAECCLREHKVKVRVQCQRKEMNFIFWERQTKHELLCIPVA